MRPCVRGQNPAQNPTQGGGGELTIDATGVPGVSPVAPALSSDTSQCTVPVYHVNVAGAVDLTIKSSATSSNPAYLCVISPSLPQPIVIYGGFSGGVTKPKVTWTADPGTPGGPLGALNLL